MPSDFSDSFGFENLFGKVILIILWIFQQARNDQHLSVNLCVLKCRYSAFFFLYPGWRKDADSPCILLSKNEFEVPPHYPFLLSVFLINDPLKNDKIICLHCRVLVIYFASEFNCNTCNFDAQQMTNAEMNGCTTTVPNWCGQ